MKTEILKDLIIGGSIAGAVLAGGALCLVFGHTPKSGIPCPHPTMRTNDILKMAHNKPWKVIPYRPVYDMVVRFNQQCNINHQIK